METNTNLAKTMDEYISQFPIDIQKILKKLKKVIKEVAPDSEERMTWNMPTFYLHGNLVHFATHTHHIGFYPGYTGVHAFQDKLVDYKTSKGAIQFPINIPLPYELIQEIVKFRVEENMKK